MRRYLSLFPAAWVALMLTNSMPTHAQLSATGENCNLQQVSSYMFDYRRAKWLDKARYDWQLKDVEDNHFRPHTETLVRPTSARYIGHDIDYVLTRWPNHHRVLAALVRLGERERTDRPPGTVYSIGCYFERALNYAKDDTVTRGLYASYLAQRSMRPQALAQLEQLLQYAQENPLSQHNTGLIYLELQEYELALRQAHVAEELGMPPNNQLRSRLEAAGKWRAPDAVLAPPVPAASASSSGS
jgi:tetratricopeptide (TPR) repeat protein